MKSILDVTSNSDVTTSISLNASLEKANSKNLMKKVKHH